MDLSLLQFASILVGIFFCYTTYINRKKGVFTDTDAAIWFAVWGGLIVLAIAAGTVFPLYTTMIGAYRLADLVMVASIVAMFSIVFILYREFAAQRLKFNQLVKRIAFDKPEKEKE